MYMANLHNVQNSQQKHTTKNFVRFLHHFRLLSMYTWVVWSVSPMQSLAKKLPGYLICDWSQFCGGFTGPQVPAAKPSFRGTPLASALSPVTRAKIKTKWLTSEKEPAGNHRSLRSNSSLVTSSCSRSFAHTQSPNSSLRWENRK